MVHTSHVLSPLELANTSYLFQPIYVPIPIHTCSLWISLSMARLARLYNTLHTFYSLPYSHLTIFVCMGCILENKSEVRIHSCWKIDGWKQWGILKTEYSCTIVNGDIFEHRIISLVLLPRHFHTVYSKTTCKQQWLCVIVEEVVIRYAPETYPCVN